MMEMNRPSVRLAHFLDSMLIEEKGDEYIVMTCGLCQGEVCSVEDGDTMRVLFNTALAHTC